MKYYFLITLLVIFIMVLLFTYLKYIEEWFQTNVNNYSNYCHHLEYISYAFTNINNNTVRYPYYLYNKKNKSLIEYYKKHHNIKFTKEFWIFNKYYVNNNIKNPISFRNYFKQTENRNRIIYVSRGNSKRRKIINEDYLIEFLKLKIPEIEILSFNKDTTFLEQATIFSNCKLFISLHGAAIYNLVYMPENSTIIEIIPNISLSKEHFNHFGLKAKKLNINHRYLRIDNYKKSIESYAFPRDSFIELEKKDLNTLEKYIDKSTY